MLMKFEGSCLSKKKKQSNFVYEKSFCGLILLLQTLPDSVGVGLIAANISLSFS